MSVRKKGLAAGQLVTLILVIVSFTVVGGVVSKIYAKEGCKEHEALCHTSVGMRAATAVQVSDIADVALGPIFCKTCDKKISGKREAVKTGIANAMARCWWVFHEGRYQEILTEQHDEVFSTVLGLDKTENDCFLCSTILIEEDDFGEEGMITSNEMLNFMVDTQYPKLRNTTYLQYIQSFGGPGRVAIGTDIKPRHAYGVSFLAKNKEADGTVAFWKGVGELAVAYAARAVAVGAVAGAVVGCYTLGTAVSLGTAIPVCVAITGAAGSFIAGAVVVGAGATTMAINDFKVALYESERDTSVIMLDNLTSAQERCFEGDLGGR